MPYLPVELDAVNQFPLVAAAGGVSVEKVSHGFLQLWAYCFRSESDRVTPVHIRGFFGADITDALEAFGFLERDGQPALRVKGAEEKLLQPRRRLREGQVKGGHAAKKHLIPGARHRKTSPEVSREGSPEILSAQPDRAEREPRDSLGSSGLLTPSTQHQSPLKEDLVEQARPDPVGGMSGTPAPPAVVAGAQPDRRKPENGAQRVFEHWRQKLRPKAVFDQKRRTKVEARLKEGYSVEDLCRAVDGCAQTPHNMGQNDRGERYDDLELICRDAAHVDRFMRNAGSTPRPSAASPPEPSGPVCKTPEQLLAEEIEKAEKRRVARALAGGSP